MFELEEGFPEVGDFVMCTVSEIFPYGAMVKLDEYQLEGMIPIREISSSWVKNIRNHVKENQKVVCKVLRVDTAKQHIDLSLRKVTNKQQKAAVKSYKTKKKGNKLLEYFGTQNGISQEQLLEMYTNIMSKYAVVYDFFELVVAKDKSLLAGIVPDEYVDSLYDIIISNIETPLVEIHGEITVTCPQGDGVLHIKENLSKVVEDNTDEDVKVEIRLLGSPRYSIKIVAPDYKVAETSLENVVSQITSLMSACSGEVEFTRNK